MWGRSGLKTSTPVSFYLHRGFELFYLDGYAVQGRNHRRRIEIGFVRYVVEADRVEFRRRGELRARHVLTIAIWQVQDAGLHSAGDFDQHFKR